MYFPINKFISDSILKLNFYELLVTISIITILKKYSYNYNFFQ